MTTSVGIRGLKRDAARLVQRALRGERVTVTRYGKPAAYLVPATEVAQTDDNPRMRAWERERAAFARLEPRLRRTRRGRWVGVCRGRVVAVGGDPESLSRRLFRRFPGDAFFIGRVGAPPELLELPGFELR